MDAYHFPNSFVIASDSKFGGGTREYSDVTFKSCDWFKMTSGTSSPLIGPNE